VVVTDVVQGAGIDRQHHAAFPKLGDLLGVGEAMVPGAGRTRTTTPSKMSTLPSATTCSTTPIRSPSRS